MTCKTSERDLIKEIILYDMILSGAHVELCHMVRAGDFIYAARLLALINMNLMSY